MSDNPHKLDNSLYGERAQRLGCDTERDRRCAKCEGLEAALKSRRIQTPNDEYEQGWNRGLEVAALLLAQDT